MPRKENRGGARSGTPGKTYSNRTDLNGTQPIRVATGQPYGEAGQQAAAQAAVPLPDNVTPPPASPVPTGPLAGELGALDSPTARPSEPLTHGLMSGPGAGPEVLPSPNEDVGLQLRALYQKYPNQDLLDLIEAFDDNEEIFGGG